MSKFQSNKSLNVVRVMYVIVCELAGAALAYNLLGEDKMWIGLVVGLIVAGFFIMVEGMAKQYTIRGFSTGSFGLMVGIFCAWLLTRVGIPDILSTVFNLLGDESKNLNFAFNAFIFSSFGFLGTVIALRSSHDDFSFVIPYVRFRQDSTAGRPLLVDEDVITDGRLPAVMRSGFLEKNLVIPRFVLEELQIMSNSPSPGRRQRGQRGLECLEDLRNSRDVRVTVHDSKAESNEDTHDAHLLQISRLINARILTTDDNLTKVAKLQEVDVLNLNEINDALKPKVDVGTRVQLALVRTGKEEHQGVGYLPDGTMIVVNNGVSKIGTTQSVIVISTINTSAGLMVFADLDE